MQNLYTGQLGQIQGDAGDSRVFPITAGVRQGCVLSPRLFTAILQWAMQKWRQRVENSTCGIDLEDGDSKLLDLRFADDLLLFARTKCEAIFMLETLMEELACVGLCLNAGKTVVLTIEAQPPNCLTLTNHETIVVKGNDVGHNWLGCILSAGAEGRSTLDIAYHLQAASRAFFANKQILCDKKVRLAVRFRFFDRVITPVALFASGHRTIRMGDLYKLDVVFRKMLRMIVGPPHFVEWNAPWHDILHHWNGKAVALAQQHGLKTWLEQCLQQHWKLAMHVANSPPNRWDKRVLVWNPNGSRKRGYPRHDWTSKLVAYTRFQQLGDWQMLAQDRPLWMQLSDDFAKFCCRRWFCWSHIACAPKGAAFGHAGAKSKSKFRTTFHNFSPVPGTSCPMGHSGLTIHDLSMTTRQVLCPDPFPGTTEFPRQGVS